MLTHRIDDEHGEQPRRRGIGGVGAHAMVGTGLSNHASQELRRYSHVETSPYCASSSSETPLVVLNRL